jgi:hypothetical protein
MKRIFLFVLMFSSLISCEKEEKGKYDLFPLQAGNEFYYTYYKYRYSGLASYTGGVETWKVVSESSQGNSITYLIERKLNATYRFLGDSIIISDSTRFLMVNETRSSSVISVFGFSFKRHQDVSEIELKKEGNTNTSSWSYIFEADKGMTEYQYYHPPNQVEIESLILDSLKVLQ